MDLISIIVPIYSVESYLNKCIDSIINQTYKNLEIILVDDGSPDDCGKICDEYAKKDRRIKVMHKVNGGLSDARNAGLDIANGEYISFVDSDDWLEVNALEVLIGDCDFSIGSCKTLTLRNIFYYVIKDARLNQEEFKDFFVEEAERKNLVISTPWAKLYRRTIINDNKIVFDEKLKVSEDIKFNYEYFKHIKSVFCSSQIVYNYYAINENSLSKKYYENFFNYKKITYDKLVDWLSDSKYKGFLISDFVEVVYSTLHHYIANCNNTEASEIIDKIFRENVELFTETFEMVDKRLGGGYLQLLESKNWKALAFRWKRKNIRGEIKRKIKTILFKSKILKTKVRKA